MKYFFALIILFTILSCSKKEEPVQDLGAEVAGTYQVTRIGLNDNFMKAPTATTSGTVVISRISPSDARMIISMKVNGASSTIDYNGSLAKVGTAIVFTLPSSDKNTHTAMVEGKSFVFKQTSVTGSSATVEASK